MNTILFLILFLAVGYLVWRDYTMSRNVKWILDTLSQLRRRIDRIKLLQLTETYGNLLEKARTGITALAENNLKKIATTLGRNVEADLNDPLLKHEEPKKEPKDLITIVGGDGFWGEDSEPRSIKILREIKERRESDKDRPLPKEDGPLQK